MYAGDELISIEPPMSVSYTHLSRIAAADLVFCTEDFSRAGIAFEPGHIVCDLCGESACYNDAATAAGCDYLATSSVMAAWGAECAELLVEFGRAEL